MHNLIMRDILHKHNGYEVKTEGDAFMVAFQEAADGLSFALEAQQRLFDAAWPSWLLEDVILKDTGGRYRFGKVLIKNIHRKIVFVTSPPRFLITSFPFRRLGRRRVAWAARTHRPAHRQVPGRD